MTGLAAAPAGAAKPVPRRRSAPALAAHALPWIGIAVGFFAFPDYLSLGVTVLTMALFALSLDLALGAAGILTLGHAAFYGIGSYAAAVFAVHVSPNPLAGLVVATVAAGLFGLLTGALILHAEGVTLIMLTLSVAALVAEGANQAHGLTGGDDGLQLPDLHPILGLFRFDMWGHTAFVYAAVVLFIWFAVSWRIMRSPFGRSLNGIRQNSRRMRAIGTPVWRRLVVAYGLSAAMAGTAGALAAQATGTVGTTALGLLTSGTALMVIVLGGMRRLYGAFVGALVYVVAQDLAAELDPFRWMFVVGGLLIAVVLFLEDGLMGLGDVARRLGRRSSGQ